MPKFKEGDYVKIKGEDQIIWKVKGKSIKPPTPQGKESLEDLYTVFNASQNKSNRQVSETQLYLVPNPNE